MSPSLLTDPSCYCVTIPLLPQRVKYEANNTNEALTELLGVSRRNVNTWYTCQNTRRFNSFVFFLISFFPSIFLFRRIVLHSCRHYHLGTTVLFCINVSARLHLYKFPSTRLCDREKNRKRGGWGGGRKKERQKKHDCSLLYSRRRNAAVDKVNETSLRHNVLVFLVLLVQRCGPKRNNLHGPSCV